MTKLNDILDSGLFIDIDGRPDYRTGKVRQQVKDLFKEIVNSSSLTLKVSETEVCPTSVLLEKIEEL